MAPSSSIDLTPAEAAHLLAIARDAIERGTRGGRSPQPPAQEGVFAQPAATFVTLTQAGRLRGCMGSLQPTEPLAVSVAHNAFNAALRDPRFAPLTPAETGATHIDLAVLSPLRPLAVASREEALAALRPGIDGLLIDDGEHHATFLPKVWEQLPAPQDFLAQLLVKAGLRRDDWTDAMRCYCYTAATFAEPRMPEAARGS